MKPVSSPPLPPLSSAAEKKRCAILHDTSSIESSVEMYARTASTATTTSTTTSAATSHHHRSKKRRAERVFGIHTFGDPGCPADYDGAFRDNIRAFLSDCAEMEPYTVEGMPTWSLLLEDDRNLSSGRLNLLIMEESTANSIHPHCDHCRCIGWSHHPVSIRRYHFIIPGPEIDDEAAATQSSILDLQDHLLHGLLHCNGYGHLLRVNGREKGSKLASGRELMDLWDRICAMLRARKVSVEDIAKKKGLELRLLHCVAYGESWYSRWGYKFGHGSFGITQQMYSKAIEAIRGMPLSVMIQHFDGVDAEVLEIVSLYQKMSGQALQTVGDLVRFMVELKSRLPLTATAANSSSSSLLDMPCRWSMKRLELATQVIVEALKNCDKKWMPRQDVRDAARVYIGDTGLLDFVLKSLGNRVVGGHVVRRAVNPITKVLEYSLEDVTASIHHHPQHHSNGAGGAAMGNGGGGGCGNGTTTAPSVKGGEVAAAVAAAAACDISRSDVQRDIVYMYKNVLESYKPASKRGGGKSILTALPTASRIILDTKQLIRDYCGHKTRKAAAAAAAASAAAGLAGGSTSRGGSTTIAGGGGNEAWEAVVDDDEMLRVMCCVILRDSDPCRNRPSPPPELVVLPPHATIGDLKLEAQRGFRDTYHIMRGFRVDTIPELEGDNEDLLFGAIESGSTLIVQGSGVDVYNEWRYEGGNDSWIVDCPCGAKDDDGERMIACDVCEVWQHTRCGGIADPDPIPARFLCARCGESLFSELRYS
ncbi:PHD finger protein PERSISTENT TAPETAL CELL 1 [Selaginella moellendorffii]|uniref:PHD finger protein PERSISTENT TAPETAL CELL 1 n=1 Tax=Selaginella moellendorffii TaxID=88036 RepID=UPI000D1CC54F|nr:PHD finger protein PERSISTENT TAPETAL CELL 1 [Selaginella moellendorffii]|eukprot:XP_024524457.1 PHD finger protein PERSISTENT TAPETAL CELL 1 [Selaginella moellendorffii]